MSYLRSNLNTLEEFVDLLISHLLAELGQDITKLPCADKTVPFFIKNLEATDKLLCPAG
jgi:hypothetical protein